MICCRRVLKTRKRVKQPRRFYCPSKIPTEKIEKKIKKYDISVMGKMGPLQMDEMELDALQRFKNKKKVKRTWSQRKEDFTRFLQEIPEKANLDNYYEKRGDLQALVKHELDFMGSASMQFGRNMREAFQILIRALNGNQMTRREKKFTQTAFIDLLRVVPFALFMIIPGGEIVLPFFLKIFPGMLPTTFIQQSQKREEMAKMLHGKTKTAKLLREALKNAPENTVGHTKLKEVLSTLRNPEVETEKNVTDMYHMFEDEALENMSPDAIRAMCQLLDLNTTMPKRFLIYSLRNKIKLLKQDDKTILKEGIENLTLEELQEACLVRGMPGKTVDIERLRARLGDWLHLSVVKDVPIVLLILSRAFIYVHPPLTKEQKVGSRVKTVEFLED
eukprot:TRINITY_DN546_c0_g1_i1.p1 TRINITY_DN546_c0_g1~~TRINITY_DN546_c0_g1_i1.p1  ORF type:complete len:389 (-),score=68.68 TRINITY_DN546_c0_g1_i1:73-1239(-)